MLTVPDDLVAHFPHTSVVLPQGTIVAYESHEDLAAQRVLVVRPTIVLVCSGIKKFSSPDRAQLHMAKAGSLIAFRSGAHMMSEFRAGEDCYRSFVISFERDFLKQVIGMPSEAGIDPPRSTVAVNISQAHWRQLCRMPSSINTFESETEKEFRLREFVFLAMADPVVRSMFYYDMADWGVSIEHRITSVLHAHYLSPLRVSELAQLCGMSLASYKRYFRDTFNTSPGEWLHRKRLDHAYGLAKRGDLMTQEICEACGYQDVSSFIRAFSRRFGKTPRAISQIE